VFVFANEARGLLAKGIFIQICIIIYLTKGVYMYATYDDGYDVIFET